MIKLISTCTKPDLIDSVILRQASLPILLLLSGCTLLSTWRTALVSFIAASLTVLCTCPLNVCISLFDHCALAAFSKLVFKVQNCSDIILILPWSYVSVFSAGTEREGLFRLRRLLFCSLLGYPTNASDRGSVRRN